VSVCVCGEVNRQQHLINTLGKGCSHRLAIKAIALTVTTVVLAVGGSHVDGKCRKRE
jgi:hypothetical protein